MHQAMIENGRTAPEGAFSRESLAAGQRYDASSIVILSGLEAVRQNPAMYIGSTGDEGIAQLVDELVDNAVDEFSSGVRGNICVTLHDDGSCSVEDDGRGIPVDVHPDAGRPACEILLTTLHSGGKFDRSCYPASAGLHGVGLCCVNALAAWLRLEVWRDGWHHRQTYSGGTAAGPVERLGASSRHGTRIRFKPDASLLRTEVFSQQATLRRLTEVAYLHPGLCLRLVDERAGLDTMLRHTSGVTGLLAYRHDGASWIHPEPVTISGSSDGLSADIAFGWTEDYAEEVGGFVNGVRTTHGGSHVDGLRAALVAAVNQYGSSRGLLDGPGGRLTAPDVLEGVAAVVSLWWRKPQFDGQTKRRLHNPEVARFVQSLVERELLLRLEADQDLGRRVMERIRDAARARLAARLASRTVRMDSRSLSIDYSVYQRQFGIRSRNWHSSCSWLTDDGLLAAHARLCEVPEGSRMLDVCCGSGVVGDAFRGRVSEMIGLDITPEMVRLASARLDKVYQGTVYDLPFEPGSFDLVVNREVLHLLPQPEKPVAEVFRVLRPGGQFIVGQIVPYSDADAYWMFRIFKKKQPLLHQMFLEPDFRRLLTGAGFTDVRVEEYFLWESIDRWIDTHETTPAHRQQIFRLYYDAPAEVRAVHPFEVGPDGSVRDQWRWCVYSARKPQH